MNPLHRWPKLVLCFSVAVAAEAGVSSAPVFAAASPCSHLTVSAAANATGYKLTSAKVAPKRRSDQDSCVYATSAILGPSLIITIMALAGPEIMASEDKNMANVAHWQLTKLDGIGDEAYAYDGMVDVRKGNVEYHFTTTSPAAKAQTVDALTKAARAANY